MATPPARARPVAVAVVGDAGVGKTALITAAATESFAERPPPTLPPTRLPADATPEGVPLVLNDTSSRDEDRAVTEAALRAADAVVLAFDAGKRGAKGWARARGVGARGAAAAAPRARGVATSTARSRPGRRGAAATPTTPSPPPL
jgi:hypothetical protein